MAKDEYDRQTQLIVFGSVLIGAVVLITVMINQYYKYNIKYQKPQVIIIQQRVVRPLPAVKQGNFYNGAKLPVR